MGLNIRPKRFGVKTVVIAKYIRRYTHECGFYMTEDLPKAIEKELYRMLDRAMERSKANGRVTIKPSDL